MPGAYQKLIQLGIQGNVGRYYETAGCKQILNHTAIKYGFSAITTRTEELKTHVIFSVCHVDKAKGVMHV